MFEYKTYTSEPDKIYITDDVVYTIDQECAKPIILYRFGITDLGGGTWEAYEYEKREILAAIGDKNWTAVQAEIVALYNTYLAIFTTHETNIEKVNNFKGMAVPVP